LTIQITIIKIKGYGPWTLELGSDREAQLQILQSNIYIKLQEKFSERGGIVYSNRFDELVAITNGISLNQHIEIQHELSEFHRELKLLMFVGIGSTPLDANIDAYDAFMKNHISKNNIFVNNANSPQPSERGTHIQVLHLDLDSSTTSLKTLSTYEVTALIFNIYSGLINEFIRLKSLAFYLGGDNFMIISNNLNHEKIEAVIHRINNAHKIKFNCGIGTGLTGREAVMSATKALDTIRKLRHNGIITSIRENVADT
jgi:GTP cyclohydrolase IIa